MKEKGGECPLNANATERMDGKYNVQMDGREMLVRDECVERVMEVRRKETSSKPIVVGVEERY